MSEAKVGWSVSPSQLKLDYVRRYATGQTALDLGCGRGWYAVALADRGFRVTAIDQVNRVQDPRVTVLEQPIQAPLPFSDGAFDTVLMFDILEHLPDEEGILREVARVCTGRLILSVPHADAGPLPHYGLTYVHYTDNTHLREYTPSQLRALLEAHGFRTLRLALEGQPTIPLAFSEFVRGGAWVRQAVRYLITALYKIGIIYNETVAGDIFYVGERENQK
jgi:SAM-dependent methyltransferase